MPGFAFIFISYATYTHDYHLPQRGKEPGGAVGLEGTKCGLWQSYESYFDMKPVVTLCHIMLYLNAYLTVVYKKP